MQLRQSIINKTELKKFFSRAGVFILGSPIVVFIGVMLASLVFIFVVWWQHVFNLDFSREAEREGIVLKEKDLTEAVQIIEQRKERFDGAPKQEYRNLFR